MKAAATTGLLLAAGALALASLAAERASTVAPSPTPKAAAARAIAPSCPPSPCTEPAAYRCEALHRLRGIQSYLVRHAPDGFTYDPERSLGALETALAPSGPAAGDDWWNPVAARALHLLSDASALDPAAPRGEWLQALDDLVALTHAFEILPQEQRDCRGRDPAGLRPRRAARDRMITVWSGVRRTFREHLERPRGDGLCSPGAPARRPPAARDGRHLVLAHQGGLSRWPPNSLAALRRARDLGADGIECDLRLSGDGQVFVLHDEELLDAGGHTLHVATTAAATLERVSLRDPFTLDRPSTQSPLALRTLLDELGGTMVLWLELKPDGGDALPERVGELLAERSLPPGTVVVSSLSAKMVAPLRRRFPELLIAYEIVDVTPGTVETLAAAPDAHRLIVSGLHFSTRSPEAFRRAQELGLRTSSFTPDRFDALARALAAGVDYIQTDRPDRALWLRDRRPGSPSSPISR